MGQLEIVEENEDSDHMPTLPLQTIENKRKLKQHSQLRNPSSSGAVDEEIKSSKYGSLQINLPKYSDMNSMDGVS